MAGKMLSSLKAAAKSGAAVSHEAKLGMMVITILFFAFCFLVYHKMDLHQRQLTQASIQSTAESPATESPAADQPLDAATQLASQGTKSAATDPLLNLADLSGEETFGSASNSADVVSSDAGSNASQAPIEFGTLEESQNAVVLNEPSSLDLGTSTEFPAASAAAEDSIPTFGFGQPETQNTAPSGPELLQAPNSANGELLTADEPAMSEPGELAESAEVFGDLALTEPEDASTAEPVSAPNSDFEFSSEPVASSVASAESATATAELGFDELSSTDSLTPPTSVPTPALESEPTLLAMAEPSAQEGFSGGFAADVVESAEPTIGRAPGEESIGSFSESSPSKGFNAVTQPGRQANGSSVRTAAGSGSDGKFSLSAFNYQNTGTEPAPDDGSTFESVVVQDGDNYSRISKRVYGTTRYFSALAVFNQHRIREPKHMRPGMIVLTPAKELLEEKYPQLFVDSKPKVVQPAEFMILDDGSPAYRVGERETLSEIAGRFLGRSSRWVEIYRLNQTVVKDPNKLKAGLILALPADAAEVNVAP